MTFILEYLFNFRNFHLMETRSKKIEISSQNLNKRNCFATHFLRTSACTNKSLWINAVSCIRLSKSWYFHKMNFKICKISCKLDELLKKTIHRSRQIKNMWFQNFGLPANSNDYSIHWFAASVRFTFEFAPTNKIFFATSVAK